MVRFHATINSLASLQAQHSYGGVAARLRRADRVTSPWLGWGISPFIACFTLDGSLVELNRI
ncbi:MAG: hypothetical protein U1F54_16730 [Burkholderiales bacterium]